jgi:hypothetical protein
MNPLLILEAVLLASRRSALPCTLGEMLTGTALTKQIFNT